jgi:hypothetical protein
MNDDCEKNELISGYCSIDERVAPLVRFAKKWSKCRNIGDAKFGSLNQFGFTLLMIQYLQRCDPPILPRLHYYGEDRPRYIVLCYAIIHHETHHLIPTACHTETEGMKGWTEWVGASLIDWLIEERCDYYDQHQDLLDMDVITKIVLVHWYMASLGCMHLMSILRLMPYQFVVASQY